MNYAFAAEELETHEDLDCETTDQLFVQTVVVVTDYELVEVLAEKLEDYANVLTEYDEIFYFDDV